MRTRALVLLLAWSIPGVLSAVQVWLLTLDHPDPLAAYLSQIPPWWLWAAATPALARLSDRRPLLGRGGLRNLPWHIAACIALTIGHALIVLVLGRLVGSALARLPFFFGWWIVSLKVIFAVALAYAAVIALHHTLGLRRASAELEVRLARAQLDALRLQIRPHFLFNTLNTIAMQVRVPTIAPGSDAGRGRQRPRRAGDPVRFELLGRARHRRRAQGRDQRRARRAPRGFAQGRCF